MRTKAKHGAPLRLLPLLALVVSCCALAADPQLYSKQPQRVNVTQFKFAEYDRAAEQFLRSATDAEQIVAARKMSELARTYMPELPAIFRLENDFVQPWLLGFRPPVFATYWKYLDIDLARRQAK
jgi:hypothetical protein